MLTIRLWHSKLIPLLPDSQLKAQKRECDLIWKDIRNGKQTNHILINYIWDYPDYQDRLRGYYKLLHNEFLKRGFLFRDNSIKGSVISDNPFPLHHTKRYMKQCFYNLQEKYDRHQRDFTEERYNKLFDYVMNKI